MLGAKVEILVCLRHEMPGHVAILNFALDVNHAEGIIALDDCAAAVGVAFMLSTAVPLFLTWVRTPLRLTAVS
jgi:hypothetical protein